MRFLKSIAVLCLMLCSSSNGWGQERVAIGRVHDRLLAVVPMVGTGTLEDPIRPAYVPKHLLPRPLGQPRPANDPLTVAAAKGEAPKAIISFSYVLSDDSRFALVQFQATEPAAFAPLLQAARTPGSSTESGVNRNALDGGFDLKVFEIGKAKRNDIENEFRKHKKDFTLDSFLGRVP